MIDRYKVGALRMMTARVLEDLALAEQLLDRPPITAGGERGAPVSAGEVLSVAAALVGRARERLAGPEGVVKAFDDWKAIGALG